MSSHHIDNDINTCFNPTGHEKIDFNLIRHHELHNAPYQLAINLDNQIFGTDFFIETPETPEATHALLTVLRNALLKKEQPSAEELARLEKTGFLPIAFAKRTIILDKDEYEQLIIHTTHGPIVTDLIERNLTGGLGNLPDELNRKTVLSEESTRELSLKSSKFTHMEETNILLTGQTIHIQ